MGKSEGEKCLKQKRCLNWTHGELFDVVNGSTLLQSGKLFFKVAFDKDLTFRQLYDYLKQHRENVINKSIPHWSCLCEICENTLYLVEGMNKKLPIEERLSNFMNSLMERFFCSPDQA